MAIDREDIDFRSYRHIFVDGNQTVARDDIRLGFESDRKSILFRSGEATKFNFPLVSEESPLYSSSGIPISATSMVVDGAVCGKVPYQADRVYAKMAGYGWKDRWGNQIPEIVQNGEWLCAWLSGERDDPLNAVWLDRWYDANAMASADALYSTDDGKVADVASDVRFSPGCMYMYDRIGRDDMRGFVEDIDGDDLLVRVDEWGLDGCVNDAPMTSSVVQTENVECTSSMFGRRRVTPDNNYGITYDTNGYVQVNPENVAYPGSGDMTVSVFLESDDWRKSTGDGIVDNGFHGGWRIAATSMPKTSMTVVLCDDSDGNQLVGIYDPQLNVKTKRTIDRTDDKNLVNLVCADGEYYAWVVGNDSVSKMDLMGNTVHSAPLPSALSGGMCVGMQMLGNVSGDTSAYGYGDAVLWSLDGRCFVFNLMTFEFVAEDVDLRGTANEVVASGCGWLDITEDGPVLEEDIDFDDGYHGVSTAVVSDGTAFVLESPDDEGGGPHRLIRIAKTKIDSFARRGFVSLNPDYGKPERVVATVRTTSEGVDDAVYVFFDIGYVVAFDSRLRRLWARRIFAGRWRFRDVSSDYEFGRRFLHNVLYARAVFCDSELLNYNGGMRVLLTYPLSKLSAVDWNMVSLVRDSESVRLCLNGITVDRRVFSDAERKSWPFISYLEKCPIVLGATCGKARALGDETGFLNTKWNGSMDDFRMYSKALTDEELKFVVMSRYEVPDMVWNMEIPDKYYVEAIRRMYKMKMPGSKSAFYDVTIDGFRGSSTELRESVADSVVGAIPEISPAYTKLIGMRFHGNRDD